MAKAGEVQPLVRAIEGHPNNEVRLAVVKLLALSGQKEILPAFAIRKRSEKASYVLSRLSPVSCEMASPARPDEEMAEPTLRRRSGLASRRARVNDSARSVRSS
jgi:hypothetical protein